MDDFDDDPLFAYATQPPPYYVRDKWNRNAKHLNSKDRSEIAQRLMAGETAKALADEYGVRRHVVDKIKYQGP